MTASKGASTDRNRVYRQRLHADGLHQVIVALPRATVAFIDETQRRHGLHNRSAALLKLLEEGRPMTQQ